MNLSTSRHMHPDPKARLLLMLHGWGLHGGIWEGLGAPSPRGPEQDAGYSYLTPDLPGHGHDHSYGNSYGNSYGTGAEVDAYTLDALARHHEDRLARRTVLTGWSLGGMVALTLTRRRPERIAGLVLIGATPRFTTAPGWPHALDPAVLADFSTALENDAEATLRRFLALQSQGCPGARSLTRRLRALAEDAPPPRASALAGGLDILRSADLRDLLNEIHCPVLLIHGERDPVVPAAAARAMAARLADARLHLLPGAGHAPFLSHARHCHELIQAFCDEHL